MSVATAIFAKFHGGKGLPRSIARVIGVLDEELKPVAGQIGPFDVSVDAGAEAVTGNIVSAESSNPSGNIGQLAVVIPTQPNANYMVFVTVESEGTIVEDEDIGPAIIDAKTTTGFNIRITAADVVTRSITVNVLLVTVA